MTSLPILVFGVEDGQKFLLPLPSITKETVFEFEYLLFEYYAPVPSRIKRKLTLSKERLQRLKTPRLFASLRIYPVHKNVFAHEYLGQAINKYEVMPYLTPYLNPMTGEVLESALTAGNLCTFCCYLGYYTKVFEGNLVNPQNNRKSTYTTRRNNLKSSAQKDFKALDIPKYPRGELFFLHDTAAKELKTFVEEFLKEIGFTFVFLYAANMNLAHKVYHDYYPLFLDSEEYGRQMSKEGSVLIRGDLRKKKEPATCDNTHGPLLVKSLDIPFPPYDWKELQGLCKREG